jgi:hypothetical protein
MNEGKWPTLPHERKTKDSAYTCRLAVAISPDVWVLNMIGASAGPDHDNGQHFIGGTDQGWVNPCGRKCAICVLA